MTISWEGVALKQQSPLIGGWAEVWRARGVFGLSPCGGMHYPDGILWMRIPGSRSSVHREKVSLRDLPPTLLSIFGIKKPDYMTGRIPPVGAPAWQM